MVILETFAKSEKEALEQACPYLGVSEDKVDVAVYRKGSGGFLGLGQKKPAVYHILAKPGITPLDVVVKGVLSTLLHHMGYRVKFLKIETQEDGKLYVEMASPHAGFIIGKYGRTLESLQFLANLIVEKFTGSQPKILLDIENYRARRAKHLNDMALRTAEFVIRTGKSRLLDPLNPYERRLIHLALQDDERVSTESEGNGVYKRVRISRKATYIAPDGEISTYESETLVEQEEDFSGGMDPNEYDNPADMDGHVADDDDTRFNR